MAFKLKSGNKPQFKQVGSSPAKDMKTGKYSHSFESPAKHYVDDVPEHNDGHSDDLQTPEEHDAGKVESPAKQTDTTYADGSKKSKREQDFSKRHTAEKAKDKYWYKVDGKKTDRAGYLAAHKKGIANPNSPNFTDKAGLQTSHPDVHGYKSAREKARAKLKK